MGRKEVPIIGETQPEALLDSTVPPSRPADESSASASGCIGIVPWSSIDVFVSCERMVAQMMAEVSNHIKKVGYNPKSVVFMLISWFNDDNIFEPFASMPWFRG
ncbi:unnamed protein product [Toxocara canis]|uniref:Uncharacterized protein n=1 Tax=Toxocara canis TaxID=6265 RepID=A0A183VG07_TOXCA|nr:unnamed protein product [Toxocara canis]